MKRKTLHLKKCLGGGVPIKTLAKRKWFVILIAILIVGVVGLGLTYAYWTLSFTQENSNFVTSDCFHITFGGKNDINLQNAYPMSDAELYDFYESATPYHFIIENTCDSEATAIINLETIARDNKLADEYIETILYNGEKSYPEIIRSNTESEDVYSRKKYKGKYESNSKEVKLYNYQLTNNLVNQNKVIEDALTAYKLYEFKFNGKGKREFNLLQYMHQETPANENTINKAFESKITVTTAYKPTIPTNALAARGCNFAYNCTDTTRVFQENYINNTTKIVFQNKMNPPTTFEASFDESEGKDKSVMAYVVQNEDDATYTIYFQTNGNFVMPSDSSHYFSFFSKVSEIEGLEYLDTSKVTSMNSMFSDMRSLTSLNLNNFDTSNVTVMGYMFYGMSNLTDLDLSSFNTSNVNIMDYMFARMSNLTSLDLSPLDTSKVTSMSFMFYGMSGLTELDLSPLDTSQVVDMSGIFAALNRLTSIDLSPLNTEKVTNMSSMFYDMKELASLDLSPLDTKNVTNMSSMFNGVNSLRILNLRPLDTKNVKNMGSMFARMSNLTSLTFGDNFNTSNVTNMQAMFWGCENLINLDLSTFDTRNVTTMGDSNDDYGMFANSSNLRHITYGENFIRKEASEIGNMFYNCPANKPTHSSWDGATY